MSKSIYRNSGYQVDCFGNMILTVVDQYYREIEYIFPRGFWIKNIPVFINNLNKGN